MRSINYDYLPMVINEINSLRNHADNILIKADGQATGEDFEAIADDYDSINKFCQLLQQQFNSLKSDYEADKIQLSRYKEYLKLFHEFLLQGNEVFKNRNLDTTAIAEEVKRFF